MAKREFIIGDIHGCEKTLKELMFNKININKDDDLYLIGDLIDRGPKIKETIDLILNLINDGYNIKCLRGNHEQMLINAINTPKSLKEWLRNGGMDTLDSFCVMSAGHLDDIYIDFFMTLPYFYELENHIIVHAGMNFDIQDPFQDLNAMLYTRNSSVDIKKIKNKKLIVGHTPVTLDKAITSIQSDKIMVDGGCVYHKKVNGLGYLIAYEINTNALTYCQNIE